MGNWHCVPSSCAEVVYQEYLPPKIRWRYPGEKWQEIVADDFSVKREEGKCENTDYLFYGTFTHQSNHRGYKCGQKVSWRNAYPVRVTGSIVDVTVSGAIVSYTYKDRNGILREGGGTQTFINRGLHLPPSQVVDNIFFAESCKSWSLFTGNNFVVEGIYRVDQQVDDCGNCIFKAFKNNAIVHQETRGVCPEVEKIPCSLSTVDKQIEIKKLPFLERIEVVNYAYDVRMGLLIDSNNYGFLLAKGKIPSECLNIYRNNVTSIIPNDFFSITNTPENGFTVIAQICSAVGCPPPQYQVLCDSCGCESCPGDTCPIECGNYICCYNDYGISIKEIPLSNYCGGQL